jgi:hypothetical protein
MVAELMDQTSLTDVLRGSPVDSSEVAGMNGEGI